MPRKKTAKKCRHRRLGSIPASSPLGRQVMALFREHFGRAKLNRREVWRLIKEGPFWFDLMGAMKHAALRADAYAKAKAIMGNDFITPEEVMAVRSGVCYSAGEIALLARNIPPTRVLQWCNARGYVIIPAPATEMTMIQISVLKPVFFKTLRLCAKDGHFSQTEVTSKGWLLIRKEPVPNSIGKSLDEQLRLLQPIEKMPTAVDMAWLITTYLAVRKIALYDQVVVRTSSSDDKGTHAYIGHDASDVILHYTADDRRTPSGVELGVGASRPWQLRQ